MNLPPGFDWLFSKETGVLAIAAVAVWVVGSIVAIRDKNAAIREKDALIRKLSAETKKIESDTLAPERDKRKSERERVQDCARNILQSVSATVDEMFATFYLFGHPPEYVAGDKLQEAIRVARRFRHEQRYRVEIEKLIGELAALGHGTNDEALTRLHSLMLSLLARISDKKAHVANIEAGGLNGQNAAAVAKWLGEIREIQVGVASLVGEISGRLSLAQDGEEKINQAA